MTISIPPSANYPSPLTAIPSKYLDAPTVGNQQIPIEIDWATMGGAAQNGQTGVSFNMQNNATLEFDRIRTIVVDNSACGADIEIIFTDTSTTLQIPAYTPYAVIPVFTNQTQFFVVGYGVLPIDITRMTMLNFVVDPVVVPVSKEQNNAAAVVSSAAAGTTVIVPSSVQGGTVENIYMTWDDGPTAAGGFPWSIQDGTGKVLAQGAVSTAASQTINVPLLALNDANLRFRNGINLVLGTGAQGGIVVNLYYRTP